MFFNLKLISALLWLFASIAVIDLLEEEEDDTDQKLSCDEVFEKCQETLCLIHNRHLVAMVYEFMKIKKETCVQCVLDLFDEYQELYKHTSQLNNETNQSITECNNNVGKLGDVVTDKIYCLFQYRFARLVKDMFKMFKEKELYIGDQSFKDYIKATSSEYRKVIKLKKLKPNKNNPICNKTVIEILNYHNALIETADLTYRKTFNHHIYKRLNYSKTNDIHIEIPKNQTGQSETNHPDLVVDGGEPKTEWRNNLVLIIINLGLFVIGSGCGYFTQKWFPLSKHQPARFSQPSKPIANQQSTANSIDTDLLSPVQVMFVSVVLAMFYLLIYKLCAKHQSSQVQLMQGPQQSAQSQQPPGLAGSASNFNPCTISAANSTIKFPSTNLRKSQWNQSNSGLKKLSKFGGLKNQ